jgi:hypothetical protein
MGSPSGLIACGAADGAAVFGSSARGGAESGEAGLDGAFAIGSPSGLIACEAADGAAVFGASARGGVESGEAGADDPVAIGAPSGPILCEGTSVAAWFGGAGVNAGAADSKPKEARFGASTSAFPPAGTEPLFAGVVLAGGVSELPVCTGAACWLFSISEREGLRVCSFSDLTSPSVAATGSSCVGRSGALFIRAKLAQIVAAPASASPPANSFQLRELSLVDF